ncbi:hypothetical protein ACL02P_11955 [Paenibacillus sp. MB22_1]|uniref:hypothetical protein n=1 Tax=Paenibacillus sp. MB22_1 TaxID=3383121 RepID=UPI00399F5EE9
MFPLFIQAAEIFVEGFYDSLRYFTSDRDKLAKAIVHALVREQFFVALEREQVLGIFAYSAGQKRAFRFQRAELQRELG